MGYTLGKSNLTGKLDQGLGSLPVQQAPSLPTQPAPSLPMQTAPSLPMQTAPSLPMQSLRQAQQYGDVKYGGVKGGAPSNQSFLDALWAIPEGLKAATGGGYPEEASAAYNAHKSKALDDLKEGRITKDQFDRIKGAAGSQFLIGNYVNKEAHPNLNAVLSGGANALYQMFDRDESPLESLNDWYQQQRGVGYGMLDNISNKQATTTPMYPEEASAAYPEGLKPAAVGSQVAYKMPVNAEGYNTEPFWYPLYGDTWGWVGAGAVIVDPNETWYKGAHKEDTTHWGDYLSSSIYKGVI